MTRYAANARPRRGPPTGGTPRPGGLDETSRLEDEMDEIPARRRRQIRFNPRLVGTVRFFADRLTPEEIERVRKLLKVSGGPDDGIENQATPRPAG
jgi:hypothetical protein